MPAAPAPTPTDRHWRLAADAVTGHVTEQGQVTAVAELLAREDAHRVPVAAAGAAYQRGRGDVIRAVRAEIERPAPVESDVAFGLRLLHLLDDLAGSAGRVDRLDAFRAWLESGAPSDNVVDKAFVDPDAALTALDVWKAQQ